MKLLVLLLSLALLGCQSAQQSAAFKLATAPGITGRRVPNQCLPFAQDLTAKLKAQGITARVLGLYALPPINAGDTATNDAICVYEVEGETWGMGNMTFLPVRLPSGANDVELGRAFMARTNGLPHELMTAF